MLRIYKFPFKYIFNLNTFSIWNNLKFIIAVLIRKCKLRNLDYRRFCFMILNLFKWIFRVNIYIYIIHMPLLLECKSGVRSTSAFAVYFFKDLYGGPIGVGVGARDDEPWKSLKSWFRTEYRAKEYARCMYSLFIQLVIVLLTNTLKSHLFLESTWKFYGTFFLQLGFIFRYILIWPACIFFHD